MENTYIGEILKIAIPNKYTKWYCNIINNSLNKNYDEIVEKHHILPKSFNLGGEKDKNNILKLSLREHFICHYLLSKMFDGEKKQKMMFAFWRMTTRKNISISSNISSRQYEHIRNEFIKSRIGTKLSQITKDKISAIHLGKPKQYDVWNKNKIGLFHHAQDSKDKIGEAGKNISEETREKKKKAGKIHADNFLTGKTYIEIYGETSIEIKEKIRKKLKGKTLEEILGNEKAAEGRKKRSEKIPWNKGKKGCQIAWNKGLKIKK